MKYLVLLILLVGCNNIDHIERIKGEAKQFCSCHGGLLYAAIGTGLVKIECKDGTLSHTEGGRLEEFSIMGCENETE